MIFTTFKQSLEDVYIAGRKINEINNLGLDTTNITEYTTALKGLTEKQAELVLSTKKFEVEQKQTILSNAVLSKTTGELTTAELEAILVTKNRNKNQAEALLINTGLITSETAEATATNVVTAAKLKELVQTKKLTKEEANLIAAKAGVTLANQKESTSLFAGISEKIKSVGTALKGLGTGLLTVAKAHPIIAAITTALTICGGAAIVNKIKQEKAAKAIKKAYKEAKQEIEEIENTFNEKSSKTKEIAKEYAELAQGVDLLTNSNNSLSTENYERFLELSNQLSELYPSLTKDFDDNGVAILDLSGNVDTIVSSLDDLIERQRILANQEIAGQAPDFFAGYVKDVDDLEEDVDKAKKKRDKIQNAYDVLSNWQGSKTFNGLGQQTKRGQDREYRYKNDYINALEALGIDWDYDWKKAILDNKWKVTTDYDNDFDSKIHEIYVSEFGKLNDEIDYAEEQLKQKKASVQRYLYSWLQSEPFYYQLEDAGLQKAIQEALFNFDWSTLPKDVQKDGELIAKYFEENILFAISNIDDPEISKALSDIYSGTLNSKELLDAISRVQDSFGDEHPISISLQPKVDDVEPLLNKVKSKFGEKYGNKLEELTLEELKIAADLEIDPKKTKEYIESELKSLGEGGSVNLTLRPKIDASELNKNGWDAGEGIATVFSSTFSNENGTVAVNFTPIIADPDTGKYLGVLSPEELQEYAEGVIAGAEDDLNLQIGSEFKGDNAIEQAETAAEKIHELQDRLYVSRDFSLSWDEFIAKINGGLTSFTIFSEAFNAKSFESTKEKLLELATSGELSADTISSTEEYKKLMDQTGLSAEQLVEKIKEFNIKDKFDNIQYLDGILSDIQSGKTLNLSQVSELISKNESLAGSIKKVGNSYTVEEEALKSLIKSNIEKYNTAVSIQNEETKNAIKESEERINQYEAEMAAYMLTDMFKNSAPSRISGFNEPDDSALFIGKVAGFKAIISKEKKQLEELEGSLIGPLDAALFGIGSDSTSTSQMNFIEILLEKVSKATEKIQKKFENAFSLSGAKKNFTKALSQIQKEIHTNSSAYAKYMTEANKVGLKQKYVSQIQNGSLNIKEFKSDSKLYDKIQSYQQWYEKAQACKDTIDSLRESEQSLKESYVDKITEIYDRKAKTYQNRLDTTNGLISMNEDIYGYSSTALYKKAIKDTSKNISVYRKELSTLQKEQKKVDKTTNPSLWYKYQDAIVEAKGSIDDLSDSYLSLAKSKAEVSITKRDSKVEKLNTTKDLNDSKVDNAIGYSKKNTIINNNIAAEKSILAQYKTAKTDSDKLFKNEKKESSTKSFKNTLAKSGITKTLITKANTAISKGKKIPATVMNALKKQMSGNKNAESAYKQFVEYNTALDAKDTASSDYSKQKQESKSNIKQDQQQLLDSISDKKI